MRKATSTTEPASLSRKRTPKTRPSSSKIGPFTFIVTYNDDVPSELSGKASSEDDEVTLGQTVGYEGKIVIKEGMDPLMERDTIVHEHLHAIWDAAGVRSVGDLDEETVVGLLAPWVLMFLRDNPELVGYLQS